MQTAQRILLVEDDADDQAFFIEAVHRFNTSIECVVANNGVEALQLLADRPVFDIIFMDINMPIMSGLECLKKIKENPGISKIPVIILSTSAAFSHLEQSKALGAAMYCEKQPTLLGLFEEIRSILSKGIHFHVT